MNRKVNYARDYDYELWILRIVVSYTINSGEPVFVLHIFFDLPSNKFRSAQNKKIFCDWNESINEKSRCVYADIDS